MTSPKDEVTPFVVVETKKARDKKGYVGEDGRHRLNILEVQRVLSDLRQKWVIAVVNGYSWWGHSLHVVL